MDTIINDERSITKFTTVADNTISLAGHPDFLDKIVPYYELGEGDLWLAVYLGNGEIMMRVNTKHVISIEYEYLTGSGAIKKDDNHPYQCISCEKYFARDKIQDWDWDTKDTFKCQNCIINSLAESGGASA